VIEASLLFGEYIVGLEVICEMDQTEIGSCLLYVGGECAHRALVCLTACE
jgi:hypothetical protein